MKSRGALTPVSFGSFLLRFRFPGFRRPGANQAFGHILHFTRRFPPISARSGNSIFCGSGAIGGGRGEVGNRREQALDNLICVQPFGTRRVLPERKRTVDAGRDRE